MGPKSDQPINVPELNRETLAMFSGERHETRPADIREIRDLDHRWYDATRDALMKRGYRFLGDVENVTVTRIHPDMRSICRFMVSGDGRTLAAFYHLRLRTLWMRLLSLLGMVRRNARTIDFQTELTDGRFVTTANVGRFVLSQAPKSLLESHPPSTPMETLLERHGNRVREMLAREPNVWAVKFQTLEEALASEHRLHLVKCEHHQAKGGVTEGEVRAFGGKVFGRGLARTARRGEPRDDHPHAEKSERILTGCLSQLLLEGAIYFVGFVIAVLILAKCL